MIDNSATFGVNPTIAVAGTTYSAWMPITMAKAIEASIWSAAVTGGSSPTLDVTLETTPDLRAMQQNDPNNPYVVTAINTAVLTFTQQTTTAVTIETKSANVLAASPAKLGNYARFKFVAGGTVGTVYNPFMVLIARN